MPEPDIQKYCNLMNEIKHRMKVIDFFTSRKGHALYRPTTIESVCLQLRKILELIPMATLVVDKSVYVREYEKFSKCWNAELLLRDLGRINSDFYPIPLEHKQSRPNKLGERIHAYDYRKDDYLDKEEFVKVYKKCGAIMHADNPLGSKVDYEYYEKNLPLWGQRLNNLLSVHQVKLLNDRSFYLITMQVSQDDKVHYAKCDTRPVHNS